MTDLPIGYQLAAVAVIGLSFAIMLLVGVGIVWPALRDCFKEIEEE